MSAATLPVRCASRSRDRLNSRRPSPPLQWPARAVRDQASETEMWAQVWGGAPELALRRWVREPAARLARGLQASVPPKRRESHGLNPIPSRPTPSDLTPKQKAATPLTQLLAGSAFPVESSPVESFLFGSFQAASFHDGSWESFRRAGPKPSRGPW